jgi:hypothetical protein
MKPRPSDPTETRVYFGIQSTVLNYEDVIARIAGIAPTSGWSIGDVANANRRFSSTSVRVESGCPRGATAGEQMAALIDRAERAADAIIGAPGVFEHPVLEIVETFGEPPLSRSMVIDERWLSVLQKVGGGLDIDQYLDWDATDEEPPAMPEGIMWGQSLRMRLRPRTEPDATVIDITDDDRRDVDTQGKRLREFLLEMNSSPHGGYQLEIEQTLISHPFTHDSFWLDAGTVLLLHPHVREIRMRTTVELGTADSQAALVG